MVISLEVVTTLFVVEIRFFFDDTRFVGCTRFAVVTCDSIVTLSGDENHPPSSLTSLLKSLFHFFKKKFRNYHNFRDEKVKDIK